MQGFLLDPDFTLAPQVVDGSTAVESLGHSQVTLSGGSMKIGRAHVRVASSSNQVVVGATIANSQLSGGNTVVTLVGLDDGPAVITCDGMAGLFNVLASVSREVTITNKLCREVCSGYGTTRGCRSHAVEVDAVMRMQQANTFKTENMSQSQKVMYVLGLVAFCYIVASVFLFSVSRAITWQMKTMTKLPCNSWWRIWDSTSTIWMSFVTCWRRRRGYSSAGGAFRSN